MVTFSPIFAAEAITASGLMTHDDENLQPTKSSAARPKRFAGLTIACTALTCSASSVVSFAHFAGQRERFQIF
jgi:hypothetical protein